MGIPIFDAIQLLRKLFSNERVIQTLAARKKSTKGRNIRRLAGVAKDKKAEEKYKKQRGKGLNLNQIVACCDQTRRDNAVRDNVTIVTLKMTKDKQRIRSKSLTYDRTSGVLKIRPHNHIVDIIPSAGGESVDVKFSKAKRLSVNCDCEDWLYRWEYSMTKRWGACDGVHFGNGEYPTETNPGLVPGVCKHIYVLLKYMKMKGL